MESVNTVSSEVNAGKWLAALRHEFENPHELAEWVGTDVTLADLFLGDLHDEDDEAWPVFQIATAISLVRQEGGLPVDKILRRAEKRLLPER